MGAHSGPDIVTDGLVLCLDAANPESYPGTGTTWTDLSGNGNDALFLGGPLFSSENKGGIVFDGTDDYSRPNTSHSYLESSTLSITLKFSSYNNENIVLFGYRHNSGYSNPTIGTIFASAGRFSASVITYTEVYRIVTLSPSFNVGEIYTIDLTKDIVNGILKLYLNGGQYIATQTFDASAYAQWTTAGSYVGAKIGRAHV